MRQIREMLDRQAGTTRKANGNWMWPIDWVDWADVDVAGYVIKVNLLSLSFTVSCVTAIPYLFRLHVLLR